MKFDTLVKVLFQCFISRKQSSTKSCISPVTTMNKVLLPLFYFIASFTLSVKEVILFYSSAVNQDCGLRKKLLDETVPVNQTVPLNETVPINETFPVNETIPAPASLVDWSATKPRGKYLFRPFWGPLVAIWGF